MLKAYVAAQTRLMTIKERIAELRRDDSGAALIEYALIGGLIAVACATVLGTIGTNADARLDEVAAALSKPTPGGK